jgi:hypothetical protein
MTPPYRWRPIGGAADAVAGLEVDLRDCSRRAASRALKDIPA